MLRVGFDISQIAHHGGVGIYTDQLTKELVKFKDISWVFFYSLLRKRYKGDLPNVKQFPLPPTILELLFNRLRFPPIEYFIGSVDIFHSSDWMQPQTKAKKITTYHDLIPVKFPEWSHRQTVKVHREKLKLVEKEIDMVIAVSQSTKDDLLELSSIAKEKIVVIYEGVSKIFQPKTEEEIYKFKRRYNLPDKFVLAIGDNSKRKNLMKVKEASKNYPLVISGQTIPRLSYQELPLLYSCAEVLLYPSLYEGFGLPILEAMACGTPVVTSNVSSMPEVGGDAVLYVDPVKDQDIANKLSIVMNDKNVREEMIAKGFKQAKKFSWERCAKETIEAYSQIAKTVDS